jgi:hypothetical protein
VLSRQASCCVLLSLLAAACSPEAAASGTPPRQGRFGSLRDFVLFPRPEKQPPAPVFLDRFEVTRGDWAEFAATAAGDAAGAEQAMFHGDPALPVGGVDLGQARAFAHWRFARLPRADEWAAAVGDGRYEFPWGSRQDPTRANTGELGLGEPTPVGTFESGRRTGGDQPYDLIGNVGEWTETVPASWTSDELDPVASSAVGRRRTLRTPALAVWQWPAGLVPPVWAVEACGSAVPREVVGSDFLSPMAAGVESAPAGERRLRTGIRLCTTPRELLEALLADDVAPGAEDLEQLRRFVRRDGHREVLAAAWRRLDGESFAGRPLHRVLREELTR